MFLYLHEKDEKCPCPPHLTLSSIGATAFLACYLTWWDTFRNRLSPSNQSWVLHSLIYHHIFQTWGSVRGEELAYVFGMPLIGGTNHLANNYTKPEMLLSEMMMTYWTNFARTGYFIYLFIHFLRFLLLYLSVFLWVSV